MQFKGFPSGSDSKESACNEETRVRFPQAKGMATHSSILAWEVPWTEKPGGLQSMMLQRVGLNWVADTSLQLKFKVLTYVLQSH